MRRYLGKRALQREHGPLSKQQRRYRNAPKLEDSVRVNWGHRWDPLVLNGLRQIARREKKSIAWVVETVVADWFQLDQSPNRRKA